MRTGKCNDGVYEGNSERLKDTDTFAGMKRMVMNEVGCTWKTFVIVRQVHREQLGSE